MRPAQAVLRCVLLFTVGLSLHAEQSTKIDAYTVHYSVVNSTFLTPEVAQRHDIVRAENRAVLTLSVLDADQQPIPVQVNGFRVNLLSQQLPLDFRSVSEGTAHYCLASFKFTSEEMLKFHLTVELPTGRRDFEFQQKVYAP